MGRMSAGGKRAAAVVGLLVVLSGQTAGQTAGGANDGLIDGAVHLVKVGRFDEAADIFKKIVATNPTPAEALRLRNRAGYDFLAPLMDHPKLGGPVRELLRLAYEAIKANRTSPVYIAEMINLLGTPRAAQAVSHLRSCGPYAVPALVEVLRDRQRAETYQAVQSVLARMPAEAAPAMVEALRCPDPGVQAGLADALGQMRSRFALHELKRLAETPGLPHAARLPVDAAIRTILGRKAWSVKPAVEYTLELVFALHEGETWALPPGTPEALPVWTWDTEKKRLTAIEVPRGAYAHVMAERTALRLLQRWPKYEPAYPAWYLAKLGKLWAAEADPSWGWKPEDVAREVRLLGSVMGEARLIAGLKSALTRRDYRAARGFLRGLERVAAARTVRVDATVVSALSAPDRAVRYEAALVLAAADPRKPFGGSELVVPVLAEAISQATRREVIVAASDLQVANRFRSALREAGFTVHDVQTGQQALDAVAQSLAVEVVILHAALADPGIGVCLRQIRSGRRTRGTPVLLVARTEGEEAGLTTGLVRRYAHVSVLREASSAKTVRRQVAAAIVAARGRPLAAADARALSLRAARALLGIEATHPVFHLGLAATQAKVALLTGAEPLRPMACRILAAVGDAESQQALAQVALLERTSVEVVRAALQGLVDAVRRYGSALDPGQVSALPGLLDRGDPTITDLTARLIGMTGVAPEDVGGTYQRARRAARGD